MKIIAGSVIVAVILLIPPLSAQTTVPPGPVSGTWEASGSPYLIQGEITIPADSTLIIQPGVDVVFQGHYKFIVHGCLEAIGTEADSILFTSADTSLGWHGIRFIDVMQVSQLSYCIVQWGNATGDPPDNIGGGIYCQNTNLMYGVVIDHCLIRYNRAGVCGGIGGEDSPAMIPHFTISYTTISDNVGTYGCGGFGSDQTDLYYCDILRNSTMGSGGGISSGGGTISHCRIKGNSAAYDGGGITSFIFGPDLFEHCEFDSNTADNGSAVYRSTMTYCNFRECVFTNNSATHGGSVILNQTSATFDKCTFYGNSANYGSCISGGGFDTSYLRNTIMANNIGDGSVHFINPTCFRITYCDFNYNQGGNFSGWMPDSLGQLIGVNANDDSCDIFFNIFLDPLFADSSAGDYHLQSSSPCIDAGDPNSPRDPDSTIADIGAFYFDQTSIPENQPGHPIPTTFRLYQNYPNPFNSMTKLSFNLPNPSRVSLSIYDLTGRRVTTLFDGFRPAGTYNTVFDGSGLSSGIYFCQLKANHTSAIIKMILLK